MILPLLIHTVIYRYGSGGGGVGGGILTPLVSSNSEILSFYVVTYLILYSMFSGV